MKSNQKRKRTPKQAKDLPETIEERVHRHISDINSKITDDDIKSVRTELDITRDPVDQPPEENKATKKQKRSSRNKKDDQPGEKKQTTPWDQLSEGYE